MERYPLVLNGSTIEELQSGDTLKGLDKTMVGLSSVDNTADSDKPVSIAQQTALNLKQSSSEKDATGGYAGLTLFKINFKNVANTFISFLTNSNTAARTYTFQDRNGTIADDTDLALKANKASPALTGTPTLAGATSGSISLAVPAIAGSNVLTLPAATDTLVGKATVDTLTNKSIDAAQLTGIINKAQLPYNSLQVIQGNTSMPVTSASATYVDTGLTATITPHYASSKILVIVHQAGCGKSPANTYLLLRLLRNAINIIDFALHQGYTNSAVQNWPGTCSTCWLDSPATTSPVTYNTQFASGPGISYVAVQKDSETSTITLIEIAA